MHERTPPCPRMLRYRPPRIAMSLLLFAAAMQLLLPPALGKLPPSPSAGVLIVLLGSGIMLRAWWLFRVAQTAICPTATSTALITADVYRLTRNPMYLGIVLMLLGIAVATGGVLFYVAALMFFFIIDSAFCRHEEVQLRETFGNEYVRYCERVRRWL